jgi:hypothetical protein
MVGKYFDFQNILSHVWPHYLKQLRGILVSFQNINVLAYIKRNSNIGTNPNKYSLGTLIIKSKN